MTLLCDFAGRTNCLGNTEVHEHDVTKSQTVTFSPLELVNVISTGKSFRTHVLPKSRSADLTCIGGTETRRPEESPGTTAAVPAKTNSRARPGPTRIDEARIDFHSVLITLAGRDGGVDT